MYTLTVLYPRTDDPVSFDSYYDNVHIPIAKGMRGLVRWTVQRLEPKDGVAPPFHMVVQLSAATQEALTTVLKSPEGLAAAADVPNFATNGAVFLYGEQEDIPTGIVPGPGQ